MSDRCVSTVVCCRVDQNIFEALGYRLNEAQALDLEGQEIPGAAVMTDEQAAAGHYDELTALKGIPFVVSNTACPGVFGDHLLASDGETWVYAEALWESGYPAVRVNHDGGTSSDDLANARQYCHVYDRAIERIRQRAD